MAARSLTRAGCALPGVYEFNKMRKTLSTAWVLLNPVVTVTSRAPVSVTSVTPSRMAVGAGAEVTLTGKGLCALTLSTNYPGVTHLERGL